MSPASAGRRNSALHPLLFQKLLCQAYPPFHFGNDLQKKWPLERNEGSSHVTIQQQVSHIVLENGSCVLPMDLRHEQLYNAQRQIGGVGAGGLFLQTGGLGQST